MRIRKFRPKDYKELVEVLKSGGLFHKDIDSYEVRMRVHKNSPDLFLVAEEDKKIVGTVLGQGEGRVGIIWGLAVLPKYRGKGIGKRLIIELEKKFKKRKCLGTSLLVQPKRKIAIKMYKSLGYELIKGLYVMRKKKLK